MLWGCLMRNWTKRGSEYLIDSKLNNVNCLEYQQLISLRLSLTLKTTGGVYHDIPFWKNEIKNKK